jgi:vacuolar-type H+-ATPase subunit I/STV1
MQQTVGRRTEAAPAVIGLILIAVGATALIARELGVNLFAAVGTWGWPFLVIVPGLVLLGASLVPAPPKGIGFAIAGAIVTTVGALLLYQLRSSHWESWAYAWALIPASAGVAMILYGLLFRTPRLVTSGAWLGGVAIVLFGIGGWYFESVFMGGQRYADLWAWWPVAVVVVGAIIALRAFVGPRTGSPAGPAGDPHAAGVERDPSRPA